MPMNTNEQLLAEAIKSMLHQDAHLGLPDDNFKMQPHERGFEYLHEEILDMFAIKAAELLHTESVVSAFNKTHNYKYIDDWTFMPAFIQEMVSRGVPQNERIKANKYVIDIIEQLQEENENWSERDAGFDTNLDEIRKVSQPKQASKFTNEKRRINNTNIEKPVHGDASPSRTPSTRPTTKDGYDAESNNEFKNQPGKL